MPNPNVLYSSVAQYSAAIVAILGGFVTTAVINLVARRRGIDEEIGDLRRELALAERERDEAWSAHEKLRAEHLIEEKTDEILEDRAPIPNAEEAYARLKAGDIRREDFDAAWDEFRAEIDRVRRLVVAGLKQHPPKTMFFDRWREKNELTFAEEDLWLAEKLFNRTQRSKVPAATEAPAAPRTRSAWDPYGIDPSNYQPRLDPAFEVENWRAAREADAAHDAALQRHRDVFNEAERRVTRAAARLEMLEERQRMSRALPPDLRWGFLALAFLAAGGIVVPLSLMPQSQTDYRPGHKILVIVLFVIGLVWVLAYFGWLALHRGDHSDGASAERRETTASRPSH